MKIVKKVIITEEEALDIISEYANKKSGGFFKGKKISITQPEPGRGGFEVEGEEEIRLDIDIHKD